MNEGYWPVKYWSRQYWPEYWPEIGEAIVLLGDVDCLSSRTLGALALERLGARSIGGLSGGHVDFVAGQSVSAELTGEPIRTALLKGRSPCR